MNGAINTISNMLTLKKVNKEIQKHCPNIELVRGRGYFYLVGINEQGEQEIRDRKRTSIYSNTLNCQEIMSWVVDVKIIMGCYNQYFN